MRRLIYAIGIAALLGGCVTEIHIVGDGNNVETRNGPQSAMNAGRDVVGSESTADVQTNPVTSFLPW